MCILGSDPPSSDSARWLVGAGSHKSLFERPLELYGIHPNQSSFQQTKYGDFPSVSTENSRFCGVTGKFGEGARRATRQDQYPETGKFGEFTGQAETIEHTSLPSSAVLDGRILKAALPVETAAKS